jgi:hypothetical protein
MAFGNIGATSSVTGTDHRSLGHLNTGVGFRILLGLWMCIYVFLHSVVVKAVRWSHPASREPYHLTEQGFVKSSKTRRWRSESGCSSKKNLLDQWWRPWDGVTSRAKSRAPCVLKSLENRKGTARLRIKLSCNRQACWTVGRGLMTVCSSIQNDHPLLLMKI